jgi:hypothetical protein
MLFDPAATTQLIANAAASPEAMDPDFISLEGLGKDLLIFLSASVFVAPAAKTLKLPPVLMYLALGCLIGPYGLDLFSDTTVRQGTTR